MFIGRKEEIESLQALSQKSKPSLGVIYGRRRVGKTALVEHAFDGNELWKFEGLEGAPVKKQIDHFMFVLAQYSGDEALKEKKSAVSWEEAFLILSQKLHRRKCIVFFDEFQWMAGMRGAMVALFKWAWDNHFSKLPHCCFLLCGSVSSFMVKKVIRSKALYGRVDLEIDLKPLTISESAILLNPNKEKREVLETYMVLGGIPQYLLEIDHEKSLTQNLINLAFRSNGYFFNEYRRLFVSHFGSNPRYERAIVSLSQKPVQTIPELARSLEMETGGSFTELLEDLALAGFIERFRLVGTKPNTRRVKIRILDEFLQFYFSFVEKNRSAIETGRVNAATLLTGPIHDQWKGYAFERLCRRHYTLIAKALGFSGIRYECGAWFSSDDKQRAQIDLVFERADRVATVCELKYVSSIKTTLARDFLRRVEIFREQRELPTQNVLILGKTINVPQSVVKEFDAILYAEDVMFDIVGNLG